MRYVWLTLILIGAWLFWGLGFRGGLSQKPPVLLFPEMVFQPRLRPQRASGIFSDGMASRPPIPGTVSQEDRVKIDPWLTGKIPGSTNWIPTNPYPTTPSFLARGQERYEVFCTVCHGPSGDGQGVVTQYGMTAVANLHDSRIKELTDGELFDRITHGFNLMPAMADRIDPKDRWAIVAYVRRLQQTQPKTTNQPPSHTIP